MLQSEKYHKVIEFTFYPANHSVVRAEYSFPCIPYEMTGPDKVGFFSGFKPISTISDTVCLSSFPPQTKPNHKLIDVFSQPPSYRITVNDTDPIFFYCSQTSSCTTYGMVGAINPNTSTPLSTQASLAKNSSYSLNPGEPFPDEAPDDPVTSPPTAVPTPSTGKKGAGLSKAAIAGIVVSSVVVILLAASLFFFIGRSRTLESEMERKAATVARRRTPPSPSFYLPGAGAGTGASASSSPSSMSSPLMSMQKPPAYTQTYAYSPPPPPPPAAFGAPGYFEKEGWGGGAGGGIDRRPSNRSGGGVFDISPMTGGFVRRDEDGDEDGVQMQQMQQKQQRQRQRLEMSQVYWNGKSFVGSRRSRVVALNQGVPVEMG